MDMEEVESSNVASIGHDPETDTLHVRFKDGSLYEYRDVPAEIHQELMDSDSKGKYVTESIKGTYEHTKLE